jgi:hypothetical protein
MDYLTSFKYTDRSQELHKEYVIMVQKDMKTVAISVEDNRMKADRSFELDSSYLYTFDIESNQIQGFYFDNKS